MTIPAFDALAGRQTIAEFVAEYGHAEKDVREGFALVWRGLKTLNESSYMRSVDFDNADETAKELRRAAWRNIVERLQMRKAMSVAAWDAFEKSMRTEDPPPLTAEILDGMVRQYRHDLPTMLEDSVKEVFNWLRPPSSEYKTNTEFEIGKWVIRENMIRRSYSTWGVNYYYRQNLIALENVFNLLAGKPSRDVPGKYCSQLEKIIDAIELCDRCAGETEHFKFRGFRKGTLHLEFKNMDHVKRLNAIAGGARLKPTSS